MPVVKSLSGSGEKYLLVQFGLDSGGKMVCFVIREGTNDYAHYDLHYSKICTDEHCAWIENHADVQKPIKYCEYAYHPALVRFIGTRLHMQIPGNKKFNRDYGMSVTLMPIASSMPSYITKRIASEDTLFDTIKEACVACNMSVPHGGKKEVSTIKITNADCATTGYISYGPFATTTTTCSVTNISNTGLTSGT